MQTEIQKLQSKESKKVQIPLIYQGKQFGFFFHMGNWKNKFSNTFLTEKSFQ